MSGATGRESDKFMLRLPDGMRERIKTAADSNNRSMNAEIVATLEEKYPAPAIDHKAALEEVMALFRERLPDGDDGASFADKANERMSAMSEQNAQAFAFELLSAIIKSTERVIAERTDADGAAK